MFSIINTGIKYRFRVETYLYVQEADIKVKTKVVLQLQVGFKLYSESQDDLTDLG